MAAILSPHNRGKGGYIPQDARQRILKLHFDLMSSCKLAPQNIDPIKPIKLLRSFYAAGRL
jgi:hypothetical protein